HAPDGLLQRDHRHGPAADLHGGAQRARRDDLRELDCRLLPAAPALKASSAIKIAKAQPPRWGVAAQQPPELVMIGPASLSMIPASGGRPLSCAPQASTSSGEPGQ